jgi:hypothetical protein
MRTRLLVSLAAGLSLLLPGRLHSQNLPFRLLPDPLQTPVLQQRPDSLQKALHLQSGEQSYRNLWGVDILLSNGGFGMGAFYRRQFTEDLFGFATFSVSEAKDEREVDYIDPYSGQSYTPGKLNRFMVLPLLAGVEYRLFREDIVDNFRPYINAGLGPTMIYTMPFVRFHPNGDGTSTLENVEFFSSIGSGHPTYTVGSFVGAGARFGTDASSVFGLNVRYYFIYHLGSGLPAMFNLMTGEVTSNKKDFGGIFITLNIGMGY